MVPLEVHCTVVPVVAHAEPMSTHCDLVLDPNKGSQS